MRTAVVIPCFNDGSTILEAVASARAQEPAEIVVVNDGSTDEATLARLRALEDDGVRVVHQANGGLSAARMAGVAATSAPYVYPLDSDDQLAPGALTRLADALDANAEAAVAFGDVEMFGAADHYFDESATRLDPWILTYLSVIPASSLVRRDALLAVGGWQLNEGGYEDWDLWMTFAERGLHGVYAGGLMYRYCVAADPRMWRRAMAQHDRLVGHLRERHPQLFAERRRNWLRSSARPHEKLLFPLIDALPMTLANRQRLWSLVHDPLHILKPRWRALRARVMRARATQPTRPAGR